MGAFTFEGTASYGLVYVARGSTRIGGGEVIFVSSDGARDASFEASRTGGTTDGGGVFTAVKLELVLSETSPPAGGAGAVG